MENNGKIRCFGYTDWCNSVMQIGVAVVTTGLSMHYALDKKKYADTFATFIWPTLNLIVTAVVIAINVVQMRIANKLIRVGTAAVARAEKERARNDWHFRNIVTCIATFIWFPCFGFWTFWTQGLYFLILILALVFVVGVSRVLVTWGIYRINFPDDLDLQPFPPDVVEEYMNMARLRYQ